jgi:hypothetical protein
MVLRNDTYLREAHSNKYYDSRLNRELWKNQDGPRGPHRPLARLEAVEEAPGQLALPPRALAANGKQPTPVARLTAH